MLEYSPSSKIIIISVSLPKGDDLSPPQASFCVWKSVDGQLATHKMQWQMPATE